MGHEKRVLILGSGFSKHVAGLVKINFPVTSELISESKAIQNPCPNFWKWHESLKKTGFSEKWDIERLYDMAAIAEGTHEHLWVGDTPLEAGVLRAEIETLIGLFFFTKFDSGVLEKTVHNTEKILAALNPTSILSTNWDGLVEPVIENADCCQKIFGSAPRDDVWGFTPDWILPKQSNEIKPPETHPRSLPIHLEQPQFLKLHGSITWLVCQDHGHLTRVEHPPNPAIFNLENDRQWDNTFRCPEDHSKLNFLLLPPASNKKYSIRPFPEIWRKAFRLLVEADFVQLVGCALRPADFRLNDLITRAMMARSGKPLIFEVTDTKPDDVKSRLIDLGIAEKQIEIKAFPS